MSPSDASVPSSPSPRRPGRSRRPGGPGRQGTPAPLLAACSLAGIEAIVLVLEGLALLPALRGERLTMGLTSVVFFGVYGAGLAWCAWCLSLRQSWARAPVVMAQIIQVLVGGGFWGGRTTPVAVALILTGLLVLGGIFHPQSLAALESEDDQGR